jgi:hypothetical protein
MEAWRVWLRRKKTVGPKYHRVQFSCRPRLTRVPSDKRNKTGPEPPWGKKERVCKRRRIPFRKRKRERGSPAEKNN